MSEKTLSKENWMSCVRWSIAVGLVAYAIMLWTVIGKTDANILFMSGAIIGLLGFCVAADYYGTRYNPVVALTVCVVVAVGVFSPFGLGFCCRLVLWVCLQMPHSDTLAPDGFGMPCELVILAIGLTGLLIYMGHSVYTRLTNKTSAEQEPSHA